MTDPVRIKAAYERSPTGLKGAFVLRGGDGQPHQVRLEGATVIGWTGEGSERIQLEPSIIEAAPTLDTFVPFEVSRLGDTSSTTDSAPTGCDAPPLSSAARAASRRTW